jgi:hypothetical protein
LLHYYLYASYWHIVREKKKPPTQKKKKKKKKKSKKEKPRIFKNQKGGDE